MAGSSSSWGGAEEPPLPLAEDVHLIACDVDGTLLTTKHVVHERTVSAIKHIRATRPNLPVVISSGKQYVSCYNLREQLDLHPFPASHAHGSVIYDRDDRITHTVYLPPALVLRLLDELHAANRATFVFDETRCMFVNPERGGKDWVGIAGRYDTNVEDFVDRREEVVEDIRTGRMRIIKMTVCAEPDNVDEIMGQLRIAYPTLGLTRAIPFIFELHDPDTNKGTALQTICDSLKISPKNCLVFGDGENDVAMFKKAGYSVAMANGMQAAKDAATYVTTSNDEGGVGAFLDRIFR